MIALFRRLLLVAVASIGMFFLACTIMAAGDSPAVENTPSTGGTGSEVVGVVDYPDSGGAAKTLRTGTTRFLPVMGGDVFINRRRFLPDTAEAGEAPVTTTDNGGKFHIFNVLPGEHMIYIRDGDGNAIARTFTAPDEPTRIDVGTLHARKTAGVSLQYNGKTPGEALFFVNVLGTGMQLRCTDREQRITFDRIPTGVEQLLYVRIYRPINKAYELKPIDLQPGVIATLQSIIGD
ncbi:MAG: hypothetical protein JXA18_11300 [Chitinispirillaceae bacterium]|nr:hypothetical protein [Chitinispirillaceae bacterium]